MLDTQNVRRLEKYMQVPEYAIEPAPWWARALMKPVDGIAITIRDTIYLREQLDPTKPHDLALLAHELQHINQYAALGILKFLARYCYEFVTRGYWGISFEREAYDLQFEILRQETTT